MRNRLSIFKRAALRLERWFAGVRVEELRSRMSACGKQVSIHWPVMIQAPEHLSLGDGVVINGFVHIWAHGGVTIGESTLIASHVAITSLTHDKGAKRFADSAVAKSVRIGSNVWIGTHATILPGVTIGDGAIVGAGAVVTRDVQAGDVVAGVPAVSIRTPRT